MAGRIFLFREGTFELSDCRHFPSLPARTSRVRAARCVTTRQALKSAVLYLILAPYDNEQADMLHRIKGDKGLDELPMYT